MKNSPEAEVCHRIPSSAFPYLKGTDSLGRSESQHISYPFSKYVELSKYRIQLACLVPMKLWIGISQEP